MAIDKGYDIAEERWGWVHLRILHVWGRFEGLIWLIEMGLN